MTWWLISKCFPAGARLGSKFVGCTIPAIRCVSRQYIMPLWGIRETSLSTCIFSPIASSADSESIECFPCCFNTSDCVICRLWSKANVERGPMSLTTSGARNSDSSLFALSQARTPITWLFSCKICSTS